MALTTALTIFVAIALMFSVSHALPSTERKKSKPMEESPEPSSEEVCVDVSHLREYDSVELVHARPIRARVFCPEGTSLPCATADHLLRVDGRPVSYRDFCAMAVCERRFMNVNSVLAHRWKEEIHADGVVLTMLDARHPERLQRLLHRFLAVRRAFVSRFA